MENVIARGMNHDASATIPIFNNQQLREMALNFADV